MLAQDGPPKPGERAPAFTLERLEGGRVGLIDLRGRPVIVNFWASWCIPCRTEMPELALAWKRYRAAGLEVLAVNLTDQERRTDVPRFAEDLGIPFPVLLDVRGRVRERYDLATIPTTVFVDTAGVIRRIHPGPIGSAALISGLRTILPASTTQVPP